MTQALHKTLPENTLFFPEGLIGFHHIKEMSLRFFKNYKNKPLYHLSALTQPDVGWIVIEHTSLPLQPLTCQDYFVFYTIKLTSFVDKMMVVNLTVPLHIHKITGQGTQLILNTSPETLELGPMSEFR